MFQEARTPQTNNLVAGYILSNINTYKLFKAGNKFILTQERVNQLEALSFDWCQRQKKQAECERIMLVEEKQTHPHIL